MKNKAQKIKKQLSVAKKYFLLTKVFVLHEAKFIEIVYLEIFPVFRSDFVKMFEAL